MNAGIEFSLGIDLAQQSFAAAVAAEGSPVQEWRNLPRIELPWVPEKAEWIDALLGWLDQQCPEGRCLRVVVESTGQLSKRFARALRGRGLPEVCIINPHRSKAFGQSLGVREKTDRIDSAILALFAMVHRCEPVESSSEAQERLRELTRMRQRYVEELKTWQNRLRETTEPKTRKIVEKTTKHLKKQIEEMDRAIEQEVLDDEALTFQVNALMKIKGIKQVAATTLTAELGDLTQYGRNQIIGRAGVFAKKFESGSSVHRRARLAKGGGSQIRRVLYMGATSILNRKGPLREYAEGLRAKGLHDMEVLMALMRKLLLVSRAVMINGGKLDDSKILRGARP